MNNLIYVSAFINIYEKQPNNHNIEWRIEHFKKILEIGIKIILFISPEYEIYFVDRTLFFFGYTVSVFHDAFFG
jgi:hypothetical protein